MNTDRSIPIEPEIPCSYPQICGEFCTGRCRTTTAAGGTDREPGYYTKAEIDERFEALMGFLSWEFGHAKPEKRRLDEIRERFLK